MNYKEFADKYFALVNEKHFVDSEVEKSINFNELQAFFWHCLKHNIPQARDCQEDRLLKMLDNGGEPIADALILKYNNEYYFMYEKVKREQICCNRICIDPAYMYGYLDVWEAL